MPLIGDANFSTTITFNGGGHKLLNPVLNQVVDQSKFGLNLYGELNGLAFQPRRLQSYVDRFSSVGEMSDLDFIPENGIPNRLHLPKGKDKGYEVKTPAGQYSYSRLLSRWIDTSNTLSSVNQVTSTGLQYLRELTSTTRQLSNAAIRKILSWGTQVYAKGWGTSNGINGAGGTGEDGCALFSINHPYYEGQFSYSNVGVYSAALGKWIHPKLRDETIANEEDRIRAGRDVLLQAIEILRTGVRKQNGLQVNNPSGTYDVIIPRQLETPLKKIINYNNGNPYLMSGVGENANQTNVFNREGTRIRIIPISIFGWIDSFGQEVGTTTNWFVRNTSIIEETQSLQLATLTDFEISFWKNDQTKEYNTMILGDFAFEFGASASLGLRGSKGDGSDVDTTV